MDKRKFYESKYTARNLSVPHYFGLQFRFILRMAECHQADPAILDLGGGTGEYSLSLHNLGYNVTLFDFAEVAIAKATTMGVAKTICADFNTYDFGETRYNLVLSKGFSLLNTDNKAEFKHYVNKITSLLTTPQDFLIYWASTDLSGTWTPSGWYNLTKPDLELYFDQVLLIPAFRYGCRLPVAVNRLVSKILFGQRRLAKAITVIGLKFKG